MKPGGNGGKGNVSDFYFPFRKAWDYKEIQSVIPNIPCWKMSRQVQTLKPDCKWLCQKISSKWNTGAFTCVVRWEKGTKKMSWSVSMSFDLWLDTDWISVLILQLCDISSIHSTRTKLPFPSCFLPLGLTLFISFFPLFSELCATSSSLPLLPPVAPCRYFYLAKSSFPCFYSTVTASF